MTTSKSKKSPDRTERKEGDFMPLPRMRLLKEAAAEIKQIDPGSAVTPYFIRQLALEGKIKSVMAGRKRLINLDSLIEYLDNQCGSKSPEGTGKIKRIS